MENVNEIDYFGKTPLHRASSFGDTVIVRMLINVGADKEF